MRPRLSLTFLASLVLVPAIGQAGVLEETNLDDYQYETSESGAVPYTVGTIYAESVQLDFCLEGRQLTLLKTGQTIAMQPDDYIVINDGVMRRKKHQKPADGARERARMSSRAGKGNENENQNGNANHLGHAFDVRAVNFCASPDPGSEHTISNRRIP
jgi:hypothetical protein